MATSVGPSSKTSLSVSFFTGSEQCTSADEPSVTTQNECCSNRTFKKAEQQQQQSEVAKPEQRSE